MTPARLVGRRYIADRDPFSLGVLASYHAIDPETLERVVVEEINPHLIEEDHFDDTFQRGVAEFAALGRIAPRVIATFGKANRVHAFVREHLEGITLDRVLAELRARGEQLPIEVALAIVRELAELYRSPVRHMIGIRDIMVTPEGDVRALPELVSLQARQTVGAAVHFIDVAVAYEPPEVIRGRGRTATSGMYTLGALLYELIANRHPYARASDTMFEMMTRVTTSLAPPIQAHRDVPAYVAAFLDRTLVHDPNQRFSSWDDLVAALPALSPRQILEAMPYPPEREPPEPVVDWRGLPDDELVPVAIPKLVIQYAAVQPNAYLDAFVYRNDHRPMLAAGRLLVDAGVVTTAEYQRFVLATEGPAHLDPEADERPQVGLSHRDAARYASWAGKRLPTEAEWSHAVEVNGERLHTGVVWEWTATPADGGGFVVRGGRWRNAADRPPLPENRSYELDPAADVGFRCVQDR
jgi:hypothetical protein